jgi:glutathione S-transferase
MAAFPALVAALALLVYVGTFINAGRMRHRFAVKAPSVVGPPAFERALRVQQNTLEQLVWFLPALWLFALLVSPLWGSVLGLVWVGGRVLYAVAYQRDPDTRGPGFAIALAASAVLLLGALVGAIAAWFRRRPARRGDGASPRPAGGRSNRAAASESCCRRRATAANRARTIWRLRARRNRP